MIQVQCDIHCFGWPNDPRNRSLCVLRIYNDGTGTATRGNYVVELYAANKKMGVKGRLLKKCAIANWPRKSKPAWQLIGEAFKQLKETK